MQRRGQLKYDGTRAETRFSLSAKRVSPFKSAGASVQSTTGSRGVSISASNAGYTMFRGSVKSAGYPFHSPFSPSLPLPTSPCAITFQLDTTCSPSPLACGIWSGMACIWPLHATADWGGSSRHAKYWNLLWVVWEYIPFFWQNAVFWSPVMRSGSKSANYELEPRLSDRRGAPAGYACRCV